MLTEKKAMWKIPKSPFLLSRVLIKTVFYNELHSPSGSFLDAVRERIHVGEALTASMPL